MDDARLLATDAILDRGVRVNITHAPVRYRMVGLHRITIKPLRAGTILEISRIVIDNKLEDAIMMEDHAFLSSSIGPIAECVAIAIANSSTRIKLFRRPLKALILQLPADVIIRIFMAIEERNQKRLFLTITRYFSVLMQMMINPRTLGQVNQGS